MTSDAHHKLLTEITTTFTSLMLLIQHGEDVLEKLKGWVGLKTFIERQIGDRRHTVDVFQIPQFVKDVVQLASDVKAAEAVIAPQFPQLIADAEKIKADGEHLLGIDTPKAA